MMVGRILTWCRVVLAASLLAACQGETLTRDGAAKIIQRTVFPVPIPVTNDISLFPTGGLLVTNDTTGERIEDLTDHLDSYLSLSDADFQNKIPTIKEYFQFSNYVGQDPAAVVSYLEDYRAFFATEKFDRIAWIKGTQNSQTSPTGWRGVPRNDVENVYTILGVGVLKPKFQAECYKYAKGDRICRMLMAERKFEAVTGITGDEKRKIVEYTIRLEPTEAGKALISPSVESHSAEFALYDDGWRMIR